MVVMAEPTADMERHGAEDHLIDVTWVYPDRRRSPADSLAVQPMPTPRPDDRAREAVARRRLAVASRLAERERERVRAARVAAWSAGGRG